MTGDTEVGAGNHTRNKAEPGGILGVDHGNTADVSVFISHGERIIYHSLTYLI